MVRKKIVIFLMQLNRINIGILKLYFRRRIKRKVKWTSDFSIIEGMSMTAWQVYERIHRKIKLHNFFTLMFFFLICSITVILMFPCLMYLFFNCFEEEFEDSVELTLCKSDDLSILKNELEYFHISNLKPENLSELPLSITLDSLESNELNSFANNSLLIRNAGGKSEISEAYSIHHLSELMKCDSVIYETQITYWCKYKLLDYIMILKDRNVGVSVVRAFEINKPFDHKFGVQLLYRKINGMMIARRIVTEYQSFDYSILHIFSENKKITDILIQCLQDDCFKPSKIELRGNVSVWITTSSINAIYTNKLR